MQLHIGDIDMHFLNRAVSLIVPLPQIMQHLFNNPFPHRDNIAGVFQYGNKFHRPHSRKTFVTPAQKRLTARPPACP